ncbi:MAG: hypothetical protein JWL66_1189 [Sphingomonadales bacterium]|nr:hypothetical protein [Sphingomonadales bacterium]
MWKCYPPGLLSPFEKEQPWRPVLSDICETIDVFHLDPALFRKALEAITNRQITGHLSLEDKMVSCIEIVNTWKLAEQERAIAALAIHFRLEASANYLAAGGVHGFRHKDRWGLDMLDQGIVTCAAIEPLIEKPNRITFEGSSFEQRLLAIVETLGSV